MWHHIVPVVPHGAKWCRFRVKTTLDFHKQVFGTLDATECMIMVQYASLWCQKSILVPYHAQNAAILQVLFEFSI